MRHATLIPAPSMLCILGLLILGNGLGLLDQFPGFGILLLLSLPVLALLEVGAFAYDLFRDREIGFSREFLLRLAVHIIGIGIAAWIIVVCAKWPNFYLG